MKKEVRPAVSPGRWTAVELMRYKAEGGAPFKDVTRQVLFGDPALGCELRYFEVAPGGYSTLERHAHAHAVMILRGAGEVLLGEHIHALAERDLVSIPGATWHQFRARTDTPLGFLCMVNAERDRPELPSEEDLRILRRDPTIAGFIRT